MAFQLHRQAHQSLVRRFARSRCAADDGIVADGYHHTVQIRELRLPLGLLLGKRPSTLGVFRTPQGDAIAMVPRIWTDEAKVLRTVRSHLPDVPRCLATVGTSTLVGYVPGRVLANEVPEGGFYGTVQMTKVADFFVALAGVPKDDIPGLPADWPSDGDCQGFLERLARFSIEVVYRPNLDRFGALFDGVGAPQNAVERFLPGVVKLTKRPFSLLHTDVHRGNVVVSPRKNGERLIPIDWESALYGDPLHELATHLVRMRYVDVERDAMIGHWARAMGPRHPGAIVGLEEDLPTYMAFERVQSVYPDVMRAALRLLKQEPTEERFAKAAGEACRAVRVARQALGLGESPVGLPEAEAALRHWRDEERRAALACGHGEGASEADGTRTHGHRGPGAVSGLLGGVITTALTLGPVIQW
ncbi:aminoglycoside phosphotransferase family protein [Streptomyces sp. NBC_00028]|uniref:phosphotransferase family protein n=1 Tax=Streptomyces sp. NBC_00028 TaxID=2975624 RepID=UPI00324700D7